jgi:cytoskeletal protein RodZ
MQSVGTRLREARIKKGYTLEDLNARTRISLKNLNAIESDDLSKISSPFTYRSFVKQIADAVGVDHATLAADIQAASTTMPEPLVPGQEEEANGHPHQLQAPRPRPKSSWNWGKTVSVAAVIGLVSVYLLWRSGGMGPAKSSVNALPSTSRTLVPDESPQQSRPAVPKAIAPEQQKTKPVAAAQVPKVVPARPSESDAYAQSPVPGTEQLLPPSQIPSRAAAETSQPTAATKQLEGTTIHIELSAIEPTWLSISADGRHAYTGMLAAMQTKSFDGKDSAQIRTANAGGVNIIFNGRALGPLGARGQARTVVFTKEGYEVVRGVGSASMVRLNPTGGD